MIIKKYGGYDIEKLELLGKGTQGWVYKIDSQKCIKIFKSGDSCKKEVKTLKMAQGDPHFPKVYSYGDRYIVRECIQGIELDKYLEVHPLTLEVSAKLIDVYETLGRVGYSRQDIMLFHVFVTSDNFFRIIDTARVMKEKTTYPRRILEELNRLGYDKEFLSHVDKLRPDLFRKWVRKK
jgi:predicted Ser/Thr protein kinase